MSNLKLVVEVVSANNLMLKDGQRPANPFVELHFDDQIFTTTTIRDYRSVIWNEACCFDISDQEELPNLTLEAHLYNHDKADNSKSFLGKVCLTEMPFVDHSDESVLHYPLEEQPNGPHVKGLLALKVFVAEASDIEQRMKLSTEISSSNLLPEMDSSVDTDSDSDSSQASVAEQQIQNSIPELPIDENRTSQQSNQLVNVSQPQQQQQQQHSPPTVSQEIMSYENNEMRTSPLHQEIVPYAYAHLSSQPADDAPKETSPFLGEGNTVAGQVTRGDSFSSTCNLKLGVEVVSAHNLMLRDGRSIANAFVELRFNNQIFRTTTKKEDLNLVWNESFYFDVSDPDNLPNLILEAYLYNSKSVLGKVRLTGTSFVADSEALVLLYPLEKARRRVKGELALKVFVADNPEIRSPNPLPDSSQASSDDEQTELSKDDNQARHQFSNLPNVSQPQQQQQQQHFSPTVYQETKNYETNEMRSSPLGPEIFRMYSDSLAPPIDYALKETRPFLGGGQIVGGRVIHGDRFSSAYDLVEQMRYLYVRVVKARGLPMKDIMGRLDPFVEVRSGNYKGITKYFENQQNPEWNEVFAFAKDTMQSSVLEVVLKDKDFVKDDFIGSVRFDINEIPSRVPPISSLAPEWYRLEDKKGYKGNGELMLAVWYGTQADEAFPDAWHSDDISNSSASTRIRSNFYHSPRLWYLRVNVVEAQDLISQERNPLPDSCVNVQIGKQMLKTKMVQTRTKNPIWNEDLMFVVAEPFEDVLILSVEDRVGPDKDESIGKVVIPLNSVPRRVDNQMIKGQWFHLEKPMSAAMDENHLKKDKSSSKVHLRVMLEGGYHVFDEPIDYSSDLQPTAKQLWKPSIGVLDLGILNVDGLLPMKVRDGKGTSDTYCVAKYGHRWVRTRTIMNSLSPKYNEQYTWEVYDPATVLTIGVFDNNHIGDSNGNREGRIGKVRIRLSTLEAGRIYTHSYPLLSLHPSGVKKMGELHLAIRFSSTSLANTMFLSTRPLLPKMHYIRPLTVIQSDMLRHQAVNLVAARLSRAEPPLCQGIVEYMSHADSRQWSMRQTKANLFRIMSVFSGLCAIEKWFCKVCTWENPITTLLVHLLYAMLMCFPELILPTVVLFMFLIGLWNFRCRPRFPPHINTKISCAEPADFDELDEEFDTFPSTRHSEVIRMRYDRLRSIAGRIQAVLGDVATQGEKIQALLSWRDPRATAIVVMLCLMAAIVLYAIPFQYLALGAGFYWMRHPRFRQHQTPPTLLNFLRRLPSRQDSML